MWEHVGTKRKLGQLCRKGLTPQLPGSTETILSQLLGSYMYMYQATVSHAFPSILLHMIHVHILVVVCVANVAWWTLELLLKHFPSIFFATLYSSVLYNVWPKIDLTYQAHFDE